MKMTNLLIVLAMITTATTAFAQEQTPQTDDQVREFGPPPHPGGPQPGPGRPDPQPHPQPGPMPGPRPQPGPQPRPEPMPQPRPEPRPEPRPMPQPPRPPEPPRPYPRPMPPPPQYGTSYYTSGCAQNVDYPLCVGDQVELNATGEYVTIIGYAYSDEGMKYEIEYSNGYVDTGYLRTMLTQP